LALIGLAVAVTAIFHRPDAHFSRSTATSGRSTSSSTVFAGSSSSAVRTPTIPRSSTRSSGRRASPIPFRS
jgi:hypothetical protein